MQKVDNERLQSPRKQSKFHGLNTQNHHQGNKEVKYQNI